MRKLTVLLAGAMLMMATSAMAVTLGSYTHNYGNGAGQFDPGGSDVLSNGYVTVSDKSTDRFSDAFDFSALNYSSIDHFDLTLTYSNTANNSFLNYELWFARPGGTPDQYTSFKLNSTNGIVTQTFEVDSSLVPEFAQMVSAKNFFFWFAEESFGGDSFSLYSAKLDVDGAAPVPEPGTMVLLGIGMLGMAIYGKRRMNKEA